MTIHSTTFAMGTRPGALPTRQPNRWLYLGMATAALVILFVGIAPSFYLRPWKAASPIASLVFAHGVAFTCWALLFFAQTALAAMGRTNLHGRLGVPTAGLAAVLILSAPPMAFSAAARGVLPGDPLAFLLVMLVDIVTFAVFVGAAIHYRRRPEIHKRLMLLAMASLGPAISRWPIAVGRPLVITGVVFLFVAAAPVCDLFARRRLHPASLWGGLALLATGPLRFMLAQSEPWHRTATWLIRLVAEARH